MSRRETYATRHNGWYGSNWIRRERRLAIYLRDEFTCVYCGRSMHHWRPSSITLDHIDPVTPFGGDNRNTNLVTACRWCNGDKSDMPVELFVSTLRDPSAVAERIAKQRNADVNLALAKAIIGTKPKKSKSYAYVFNFNPESNEDATEAASSTTTVDRRRSARTRHQKRSNEEA